MVADCVKFTDLYMSQSRHVNGENVISGFPSKANASNYLLLWLPTSLLFGESRSTTWSLCEITSAALPTCSLPSFFPSV
jgi:hypothetical protein